MPSTEVREALRESGPVILAFSRGKDSIAAWLALRESGVDVIPVHYYRVPHMPMEDESLAYFEEKFGTHIINLPHPDFYRLLREYRAMPPHWCAVIDACRIPDFGYRQLEAIIRQVYATPETWYCDGVRAADSPYRRLSMVKNGPMKHKTLKASPVWDWQKADVLRALADHQIKLPRDYELFGRTFDGLDRRFIEPIAKHSPEDMAAIEKWFPLVEMSIWR